MEFWVFALFLLLLAPCIGSFLGVLVDRLPRGEDVTRAPSACRACGTRLGWRDLVPLVSFALLRGRCRQCGAAIPAWHLYLEIAATGAGVIAVLLGQGPAAMLLIAGVLWLLLALAVADLIWLRLPDVLTAALLGLALLWVWQSGGDVVQALLGAALGAGSFWAIRVVYRALRGREGLGLGDVKLMAGLGALVGPLGLPQMVLLAALLALAAAALQAGPLRATRPLPFGAALCASAALWWLLALAGQPV